MIARESNTACWKSRHEFQGCDGFVFVVVTIDKFNVNNYGRKPSKGRHWNEDYPGD